MGVGQTITRMFKIFRKYGIMDTNDPADLETEALMSYLYTSLTTAISVLITEANKKTLPSYADMMRRYTLEFDRQFDGLDIETAVRMRAKDLEKKLDGNSMVKWGMRLPYAEANYSDSIKGE